MRHAAGKRDTPNARGSQAERRFRTGLAFSYSVAHADTHSLACTDSRKDKNIATRFSACKSCLPLSWGVNRIGSGKSSPLYGVHMSVVSLPQIFDMFFLGGCPHQPGARVCIKLPGHGADEEGSFHLARETLDFVQFVANRMGSVVVHSSGSRRTVALSKDRVRKSAVSLRRREAALEVTCDSSPNMQQWTTGQENRWTVSGPIRPKTRRVPVAQERRSYIM